ncbi:hypothetical protein SEVIR_8G066900v4 [Setaria viridis]|uniref:Uncharacterized protein n=1 Tax=Setaria viridis TaxID=4556 RepID=A0A4U6TFI8_SETVI|nr:uncharacterized protein LOC117866753 [Setaria viridis]TKV99793.1 hypothetical protein SEVIR_8G066900v2 [Setaria viridis]
MAAASDRAEVDTARPFRSVKEAVAVFGDRITVGESHSRHSSSAAATATANASASANSMPTASAKHEASSSSSTMTFSPNPMAEAEEEIMPATVPMYSAPSSPPSLTSSPSPIKARGDDRDHEVGGLVVMRSIRKLEAEVAETRQEVAQLRKRGNEMEMAVASLNAQLHRGLSKLAEMEADRAAAAARRSIGGDTDVASTLRSERWGDKLGAGEYLPSFSHALSLGEIDDAELMGSRSRKAQKVKPIVPLIGDILFSKRKSTKEKLDDGFYSGDLYSVLG